MTAIETIKKALVMAYDRRDSAPEFEIFISIVNQLEYLYAVITGEEKDRTRLKNIIIGHFAVREFEESDPEFSEVLIAAQSIASKASKGLKV